MTTTSIQVGNVNVELQDEGDAIARMTRNSKDWEPQTRKVWPKLIRPGLTVLDIGAYTGVYSIASALMGAKVIAVEPHPANYRRLKKNIALNSVRVKVIKAAATDKAMPKMLRTKKPMTVLSDTASLEGDDPEWEMVHGIEIDDLKFESQVCLVKIDVEHHETKVIEGANRMLRDHKPMIMVEVLDLNAGRAVSAMLKSWSYKPKLNFDNRNWLYAMEG